MHTRLLRLATVATAVFALAAPTVGSADTPVTRLPDPGVLERVGLQRRWYLYVPVSGQREVLRRVTIVGNRAYAQTNLSMVHAIDLQDGKILWSQRVGSSGLEQHGVAANSTGVFVLDGLQLIKLKVEDGSIVWSFPLRQMPMAAPVANERRVVVTTSKGRVYTFMTERPKVEWLFQTDGRIEVPGLLTDGKVACASTDAKTYVFAEDHPRPIHMFRTDGPITAPLGIWGATALVASEDYFIYALDLRTGTMAWRAPAGAPVTKPLLVSGNDLFAATDGHGVVKLNIADGRRAWRHPDIDRLAALSPKRLYATDPIGTTLILDRATGQLVGSWNSRGFDLVVTNDQHDRLLYATSEGLLVCMHEIGASDPIALERVPPPAPRTLRPSAPKEPATETPATPEAKPAEPKTEPPAGEEKKPAEPKAEPKQN